MLYIQANEKHKHMFPLGQTDCPVCEGQKCGCCDHVTMEMSQSQHEAEILSHSDTRAQC